MAYRGRGRGRGFGGGFGYRPATPLPPFEPFPEIPALGKASDVKENRSMAVWYSKFEKFCKSSAYYIEDANESVKKKRGTKIERFSTRDSEKNRSKARLSDFINMVPDYVPAELANGDKKEKRGIKRVRWNAGSDMQLDDLFSKLQEHQSEKADEKKEEQEDDDVVEEEDEESTDDDDYNQNIDFDDDEDDFNMPDDNDDEPIF